MNLETVLKQRKFKTAEERAIVNIIFTAYRINDSHKSILDPYDISIQQYNILRILRGQHPASMSVHLLHDRMLDKNSGVSRMVEKLRAKGYVARDVNTADRRQVDVCITQAGLDLLTRLDEELKPLHGSVRILSAEELDLLNTLLDRLRCNLQK